MREQPMSQQARRFAGPVMFLMDLLYPPRCLNCGRVDTRWCDNCQNDFAQQPIVDPTQQRVFPPLHAIAATAVHDNQIQRMVQALKYENATYVAHHLGQRMAQQTIRVGWHVDAVTYVPLHMTRYRQRGYNQAKLLADEVAGLLGLPTLDGALHRDFFTRSQVGLGQAERRENVAEAFRATPNLVTGRHLLLVDDVLTTGATLQSCATALVNSGAAAVYGLTATSAQ
jgi:ComF family protein